MSQLRVLVACEMSGRVRDAFAKRGWEAWSADLLPSETPVYGEAFQGETPLSHTALSPLKHDVLACHYQGDVRDLFSWDHPVNAERRSWYGRGDRPADQQLWDLVIAHPPCTDLSLAGARYWAAKRADGRQDEAAAFFTEMVNAPAQRVAVENPRGDMTRRWRPPDQYVQPYWFGDPLAKRTGLWLKNLPLLTADNMVAPTGRTATGGGSYRVDKRNTGQANNTHEDSEGRAMRGIVRSRTPLGLARAMAAQWGSYTEERAVA